LFLRTPGNHRGLIGSFFDEPIELQGASRTNWLVLQVLF
jgi:hypothetical protein